MAARQNLTHSSIGSLLGTWTSVGENIAAGESVSDMFGALVASSGHEANILGDFTHMGVGVFKDGNGLMWTCHVFAR